jgi:hypothetical protein
MTKSRSPSRGRAVEPVAKPLSPCLVHRELSSSPPTRRQPMRRTSLPSPVTSKLVTIPLRACCPDCISITEECMKEGETWKESFSRGARRRRSASLEAAAPPRTIDNYPVTRSAFTADTIAVMRFPNRFAITVDEVDKRRKSLELIDNEFAGASHEKRTSSSSSSSSAFQPPLCNRLGPGDDSAPRKGSPIEEEDEDQLFPLPSPRRSPNASPGASPKTSPLPSPNVSLSCLEVSSATSLRPLASESRDSLPGTGSSDESGIRPSFSRKGRCERGLLTPDASPDHSHLVPSSLKDLPPLPLQMPLTSSTAADRTSPSPTDLLPSPLSSPTPPTGARARPPVVVAIPACPPVVVAIPARPPVVVAIPARPPCSRSPYDRPSRQPPSPSIYHARIHSDPSPIHSQRPPVSPPSSPVIPQATSLGQTSPIGSPRKRPTFFLSKSGSLLRAGAEVLKGVSSMGGASPGVSL